jgi:phage I-like protein
MKRRASPQPLNTFPVAACAFALEVEGDTVHILPSGTFRARDGRPHDVDAWRLDRDTAERVIAAARANAIKIPVDYEHQLLHAEKNGQPAPAAGWIDPMSLTWQDGKGLTGRAQWTAKARAHIDADEYKYLSAVFPYDKKTGQVQDLYMVSLTNFPALTTLDEVQQLAAARFSTHDHSPEDPDMNEKLLELLGLKPNSSDDVVLTALKALLAERDELKQQKTDLDTEVAALKTKVDEGGDDAPDPSKYAPISVVEDLKKQVVALSGKVQQGDIDDLVNDALEDGRLLKAQEEWARSYGEKDLAGLKAYLDSATPIAALKGTQTGGRDRNAPRDDKMTDEDLAVCRAMDVDPEEYKKVNGIGAAET